MDFEDASIACPGKVTGVVRFVRSLEDVSKINEGDIVITNNNSPLFSIAFMKSGGILSQVGGNLCHLAIVSREMNKPCLVGIENIFERINDGSRATLNATEKTLIEENE